MKAPEIPEPFLFFPFLGGIPPPYHLRVIRGSFASHSRVIRDLNPQMPRK